MASQTNAEQFIPSFYSNPNFPPAVHPFLYTQPQFYSPPLPEFPLFSQFPRSPLNLLPTAVGFPPNVQQPYQLIINKQQEVNTKANNEVSPPATALPQIQPAVPTSQIPLHDFQKFINSPFPNNFLGYSYRTQLGDGATSTVVLFQGGHPSVAVATKNRVTVASDSLDPQRAKDAEQSIEKILSGMIKIKKYVFVI